MTDKTENRIWRCLFLLIVLFGVLNLTTGWLSSPRITKIIKSPRDAVFVFYDDGAVYLGNAGDEIIYGGRNEWVLFDPASAPPENIRFHGERLSSPSEIAKEAPSRTASDQSRDSAHSVPAQLAP